MGTVPVVRATGGLDDTVENFERRARDCTGFKFTGYTGTAFLYAVKRALQALCGRAHLEAYSIERHGQGFFPGRLRLRNTPGLYEAARAVRGLGQPARTKYLLQHLIREKETAERRFCR